MVSEASGRVSSLGILAQAVDPEEKRLHGKAGVSFSVPERTERNGIRHISCHFQRKTDFYTGAHRSGKDYVLGLSGCKSAGPGKRRRYFLSDGKDDHKDSGTGSFLNPQRKGTSASVGYDNGKGKALFLRKAGMYAEKCPYAKGHFDRVNEAVYDLWISGQMFDRDTILEQAEKFKVCPFEMCLDLAVWVDAVICDYNYVFDPNVHLKRFFGENAAGDYIFLIDEAHNLVERGREMYSAVLTRREVQEARRFVKPYSPRLYRALGKVSQQLGELEMECENFQVLKAPERSRSIFLPSRGNGQAYGRSGLCGSIGGAS